MFCDPLAYLARSYLPYAIKEPPCSVALASIRSTIRYKSSQSSSIIIIYMYNPGNERVLIGTVGKGHEKWKIRNDAMQKEMLA